MGRSLSHWVNGMVFWLQISISPLGFLREASHLGQIMLPSPHSSADGSLPFLFLDHPTALPITQLWKVPVPWAPPASTPQQAFFSPGLRSGPGPLGQAQLPRLLLSHHVGPDQWKLG